MLIPRELTDAIWARDPDPCPKCHGDAFFPIEDRREASGWGEDECVTCRGTGARLTQAEYTAIHDYASKEGL